MTGQFSGTDKGNANLTITDGTTTGFGINKITVSAGDLTSASNGEAVIDTSGGGGGGGIGGTITSGQVAYGTANDTIGGDANLTWDSSTQLLKATYGVIANVYEVVADVDITKGQAVYTTGFNGGSGKPQVDLAQANSSSTMPAIGVASENILAGQTGLVIIDGQLDGITTSGSPNDIVYVSATTAGEITNVRPTGATELVQNVGNIIKVGAGGKIAITGLGRSNDVPNSFTISGSISADSITLTNPLDISDGGTNASTASGARDALGVLPKIADIRDISSDITLQLSDAGKVIFVNNGGVGGGPVNIEVPGIDFTLTDGFQCVIIAYDNSGGAITLTPTDGGTINGSATPLTLTPYNAYTLIVYSEASAPATVAKWVAIG